MAVQQVSITTVGMTDGSTKIKLASPYDAKLVRRARELGGRWLDENKVWIFDVRDRDAVGEMVSSIFGINPLADSAVEMVSIRFDVTLLDLHTDEIRFAGRTILRRPGRDMSVAMGAGVVIVSGRFSGSAGSVKNPRIADTTPTSPIIVEMRDLPASMLASFPVAYEIVQSDAQREASALADVDRILAQIANLDPAARITLLRRLDQTYAVGARS